MDEEQGDVGFIGRATGEALFIARTNAFGAGFVELVGDIIVEWLGGGRGGVAGERAGEGAGWKKDEGDE